MNVTDSARKVALIGPPKSRAHSMNRYFEHVRRAYELAGYEVREISPAGSSDLPLSRLALARSQLAVALKAAKLRKGALVHIVDHSDALYALVCRRAATVVTCHDLFAVQAMKGEIPEHTPRLSGRIYQKLVLSGLRRASVILSVSAETARDVDRIVRPRTGRSHVLHNMLEDVFLKSQDADLGVPEALHLGNAEERSVLIVGGADWRKRRELSLRIALILAASIGRDTVVKVVGPPLSRQEGMLPDASRVRMTGPVTDEQLAQLYSEATALVQMSKYEGFCWPVLEANASGTLAVCSPLPVLLEVAPGNLFVHGTEEPQEIIQMFIDACNDPSTSATVRSNARRFTLQEFSQKLHDIVTKVSS